MRLRNTRKLLSCLLVVSGVGCLVLLVGFLAILVMGPGYLVALSHIAANVPDQEEFDNILLRDLQAYFQDLEGRPVRVEYEFLRRGPTQVGAAYPKYYLWVRIYDGSILIEEGAVRIAVIEKEHIDVTHYLSRESIKANPDQIYNVFPSVYTNLNRLFVI
jgi:hypothetical protein